MNVLKRTVLPILLASMVISIFEFVRNEFLLKSYWTGHYEGMGLVFPSEPINGAVWGIWSLVFAACIYIISRKFDLKATTFLSWVVGFVLMWLVVGNMGVLPFKILVYAVPASILEVFLASLIIVKMGNPTNIGVGD